MYKVAAMGDRDSIIGLAALGLEIYPTDDTAQAAGQLKRLADNGFAVIYITEALAAAMPEEIARYRYERIPAVILIPGISGNTGEGLANVRLSVEKAVGMDIISE
jgi:V/A-type H+-transporting ATPase subunit F